jgi:hypothetical protein
MSAGRPTEAVSLRGGHRSAGDVLDAANLHELGPAAPLFANHDVGIEHGEEGVEVSLARGGEEGFHDFFFFFFCALDDDGVGQVLCLYEWLLGSPPLAGAEHVERHASDTTVTSQASRLSISLEAAFFERLKRIHASWRASSASLREPSIRGRRRLAAGGRCSWNRCAS